MPKIKNIIIFVAIAVVLGLAYVFFIKAPSDSSTNLVTTTPTPAITGTTGAVTANSISSSLAANDFLSLLLNINDIKLDDSIFSNPAFTNLRDSSITLMPDGTEGRPNPFAQFGNDSLAPTIQTTPTTPVKP